MPTTTTTTSTSTTTTTTTLTPTPTSEADCLREVTKYATVPADFGIDWSARLEAGEFIATSSWSVSAGMTVSSSYLWDSLLGATVRAAGGLLGANYILRNLVRTTLSRTDVLSLRVRILGYTTTTTTSTSSTTSATSTSTTGTTTSTSSSTTTTTTS